MGGGRWQGYALSPDRPRSIHTLNAEQRESLGRLLVSPPRVGPEEESEHAYLRVVGGLLYVCPWQTRLRSWRAYDGFSNTAPFTVGEPFAPAPEAERVEDWLTSAARPEALVELDYGGLPHLLSNDHLHADRSVEEVSGCGRGAGGGCDRADAEAARAIAGVVKVCARPKTRQLSVTGPSGFRRHHQGFRRETQPRHAARQPGTPGFSTSSESLFAREEVALAHGPTTPRQAFRNWA